MSENLIQNSEDGLVTPSTIGAGELDSNGLLKKRRKVSLDSRKARAGYMFVLPFILGVVLIYLPILLDSIWFSMSYENNSDPTNVVYEFVGLQYYKDAFTEKPDFTTTLIAGVQQLIFEVPAVIIFSLFIAVVLNQKMLGRAAFRAIFFLPVIVSTGIMETINASDLMSTTSQEGIDDGSGSNTNDIISTLDMQRLFANMKVGGELAVYVVGIVNNVYKIINYSGVQMLIFLAGLQSISPSIYEACKIDGATGWETFWKVTFPMISPMILVNSVYSIIDAFTRSENTMIKYIENNPEKYPATAMAWIYFIVIMLIIALFAAIASTFIFYQRRD
ncbi:MAG: sugar ABC transporter permease [Ruminococcaceae bacterium]|nr:sugar ABC transporter permease [Oscillospiraceae bacterium]